MKVLVSIIQDIVKWIESLFVKKEAHIPLYIVLQVHQFSTGVLKLVERHTSRAVLTYIFIPKSKETIDKGKVLSEYHFYLDHLWAVHDTTHTRNFKKIPNSQSFKIVPSKNVRKLGSATHVVNIFKNNRFKDAKGMYGSLLLFSSERDYLGKDYAAYRDKYAIPAFKDAVFQLKHRRFEEIDWSFEMTTSQKYFMSKSYIPKQEYDLKETYREEDSELDSDD